VQAPLFTSVLDLETEVAPYRAMTPEQRGEILARVCRDALELVRSRSDAERVMAFSDPLPESTRAALRRLRARMRSGK
jgi:hypothetical protein